MIYHGIRLDRYMTKSFKLIDNEAMDMVDYVTVLFVHRISTSIFYSVDTINLLVEYGTVGR